MQVRTLKVAASVIILARDATKASRYDYKMLAFTRSEKTSIFENTLCFPGGRIHDSDESPQWTSFLKHHKIPTESIRRQLGTQKPFIFDPQDGKIEREISLRLTAIRETFEELGIVLCSPASATSRSSPFTDYFHSKDLDIPFWQRKIHNSEATLMNFCDKFSLVPNILGLYEWTVWVSMMFQRKSMRYTTGIFIVLLDEIPEQCYPESHEVDCYSWMSPDEIIRLHNSKSIWLAPHILYEVHRLHSRTSIDKIASFVENRKIPQLVFSAHFVLKDSVALIYPGDDLYPKNADFYKVNYNVHEFEDRTFDELMDGCKNYCRAEMADLHLNRFETNIDEQLWKV